MILATHNITKCPKICKLANILNTKDSKGVIGIDSAIDIGSERGSDNCNVTDKSVFQRKNNIETNAYHCHGDNCNATVAL